MSGFQLDKGGVVPACVPTADPAILGPCGFYDLSPFAQGYVEAMLEWLNDKEFERACFTKGQGAEDPDIGFSDLAPETLARIMEDCERRRGSKDCVQNSERAGQSFWAMRQIGERKGFRPLTPYLGDDGKVYLREAVG